VWCADHGRGGYCSLRTGPLGRVISSIWVGGYDTRIYSLPDCRFAICLYGAVVGSKRPFRVVGVLSGGACGFVVSRGKMSEYNA
jgi:hypothetical protein